MRDQVRDDVERRLLDVLGDVQAERLVTREVECASLERGKFIDAEAFVNLLETCRVDRRPREQRFACDASALHGLHDGPDERSRETHGERAPKIAQKAAAWRPRHFSRSPRLTASPSS